MISYLLILYLLQKYFTFSNLDIFYISMYSICILCYILNVNLDSVNGSIYILNNYFIGNNVIYQIKNLIFICFFIFLILLKNFYSIIKLPVYEYLIITLTCILGLCVIISSNHLFIIFLFLELVNLCVYCLIGLNKDSNMGIEISYKYFVQSSFVTIAGFFGVSLIYAVTGTLFLNELNIFCNFEDINLFFKLGVFLIFLSLFFKLGVYPLHGWMPDLYQGALLISVIFISIIPKIAYVLLFFKLYCEFHVIVSTYCLFISLISIIYGSVVALYQTSFKRLLAYSSMFHIGLIIYSISFFTITSIASAFFYLLTYIILMLFIFSFMFFLFEKNDNGFFVLDDISKLGSILNRNYLLSLYFSFILLSLAGLPFFIGFISKWYIFLSLINKGYYIDLFFLLLLSVISATYYIRLIRFIFFVSIKENIALSRTNIKLGKWLYFLITLLFIFNILIIFFHNWIFLYILKCVNNYLIYLIWFI